MFRRFVANYVERHLHPANRLLHVIGVPLTFVVSVVFLFREQWWWAVGCFVGGYVLQFVGHAIEGNDAGEVVLMKKLLGKPYCEFGPRSPHAEAKPAPSTAPSTAPSDRSKSDD